MSRDWVEPLSGGEVLLSGPAVLWFATVAERAVHGQRLNGRADPVAAAWAQVLAAAADRVRGSGVGTSVLPIPGGVALSGPLDPVSAQEAAVLLRVSVRRVTALCSAERFETACKPRGRWVIERSEVLLLAERKAG